MKPALTRRSFLGPAERREGNLIIGSGGTIAGDAPRSTRASAGRGRGGTGPTCHGLDKPVKIASMELLGDGQLCGPGEVGRRCRGVRPQRDAHDPHLPDFPQSRRTVFRGQRCRELEPLLWELYRHNDNYKNHGLALWVCLAAAEFAILDLLGKLTGRWIGDIFGGVERRDIAVYQASGLRGNTPEEEVALKRFVAESGAKASSSAWAVA